MDYENEYILTSLKRERKKTIDSEFLLFFQRSIIFVKDRCSLWTGYGILHTAIRLVQPLEHLFLSLSHNEYNHNAQSLC